MGSATTGGALTTAAASAATAKTRRVTPPPMSSPPRRAAEPAGSLDLRLVAASCGRIGRASPRGAVHVRSRVRPGSAGLHAGPGALLGRSGDFGFPLLAPATALRLLLLGRGRLGLRRLRLLRGPLALERLLLRLGGRDARRALLFLLLCALHELEIRGLARVSQARPEPHDARIASLPIRVPG